MIGENHDAVGKADAGMKQLQKDAFEYALANDGDQGSYMKAAFNERSGRAEQLRREKEKKELQDRISAISRSIQKRIEQLDREIAALEKEIEKLDEEIAESEEKLEEKYGKDWKEKLKRGEIDSNDPLLMLYLQQVQDREVAQRTLDDKREERNNQADRLENLENAQEAKREALNSEDIQEREKAVEELEAIDQMFMDAMFDSGDVRDDQLFIGNAQDNVSREENVKHAEKRAEPVAIEDEVGAFFMEFAEISSITDELERLTREKAALEKLSPKALKEVGWTEDTKHLLEEGYFDALENAEPRQEYEQQELVVSKLEF